MTSKEVIRILEKDGWYLVNVKGSHYQFRHHRKKGRITVPFHRKDIKSGTLHAILKQAGIK